MEKEANVRHILADQNHHMNKMNINTNSHMNNQRSLFFSKNFKKNHIQTNFF